MRGVHDDGTTHVRYFFGRGETVRDRWVFARGPRGQEYHASLSVCGHRVWTADTVARATAGPKITCHGCAVFCDAWITAGKRGKLTMRRVRAFRREIRAAGLGATKAVRV